MNQETIMRVLYSACWLYGMYIISSNKHLIEKLPFKFLEKPKMDLYFLGAIGWLFSILTALTIFGYVSMTLFWLVFVAILIIPNYFKSLEKNDG